MAVLLWTSQAPALDKTELSSLSQNVFGLVGFWVLLVLLFVGFYVYVAYVFSSKQL